MSFSVLFWEPLKPTCVISSTARLTSPFACRATRPRWTYGGFANGRNYGNTDTSQLIVWLMSHKLWHDLKGKDKSFSMSQSIFQHIYIRDAPPEDLHSQGPPSSPVDTKHPLCQTPEHRLIKLNLYDLFLAEVINKRIPAGHSTPEHRGHRFPHTWQEKIICCHWIIWKKLFLPTWGTFPPPRWTDPKPCWQSPCPRWCLQLCIPKTVKLLDQI